ncbi:MAG TPA: 4Fe-4S dicluster domain-containing protein [Steroidobacteraceae bacterium]|nr:4Fe-4S dicluster domain-containing protein [Steroidobacteraceae bacterium]
MSSHATAEPAAAYVSEAKIYPRGVNGRLQKLRHAAVIGLLGLFYLVPWLSWQGRQAVLLDLPARKFHILAVTFWPQDFPLFALLLIVAALSLFFFTALAGRLWCGYACPQTVWTEVFLLIERWTEGDRLDRMRLDGAAWSLDKLLRKGSKHVLWVLLALWTGFTFVGFFTPIHELADRARLAQWGGWETFWVGFYALATWGNAGFLREQVCKYMCPYARFQSAMFDRNTLIIAYDAARGEPRGSRARSVGSVAQRGRGLLDAATAQDYAFRASQHPSAAATRAKARGTITWDRGDAPPLPQFEAAALGDCIDCTICVQVCPTGIDIRNGLQYECIACGACIDGCNQVMDKLGYPRGLIRYSTQNAIDGRPSRVVRPRVMVYGALLLLLVGGWGWGVAHRKSFLIEVLRDRNALYRVLGDGSVENDYTLKIVNKADHAVRFHVSLATAPPDARLMDVADRIDAPAGLVISVPLRIVAPALVHGRHDMVLQVSSDAQDAAGQTGQRPQRVVSSFFAPAEEINSAAGQAAAP